MKKSRGRLCVACRQAERLEELAARRLSSRLLTWIHEQPLRAGFFIVTFATAEIYGISLVWRVYHEARGNYWLGVYFAELIFMARLLLVSILGFFLALAPLMALNALIAIWDWYCARVRPVLLRLTPEDETRPRFWKVSSGLPPQVSD